MRNNSLLPHFHLRVQARSTTPAEEHVALRMVRFNSYNTVNPKHRGWESVRVKQVAKAANGWGCGIVDSVCR